MVIKIIQAQPYRCKYSSKLFRGIVSGFTYQGVAYVKCLQQPLFLPHTRNDYAYSASGDYKVLFAKTVPANSGALIVLTDASACNPVAQAGGANGLGAGAPLRNRGIVLERGDRIYVGVFPDGPNISGYTAGAHISARILLSMAKRRSSSVLSIKHKTSVQIALPIRTEFSQGSVPDSIYSANRESAWSRWRRGFEIYANSLYDESYSYTFTFIPLPPGSLKPT